MKPVTRSFNILLNAYSKKNRNPDYAIKVGQILNQLITDYENGRKTSYLPDATSFNIVLNSYTKSSLLDAKAAYRAENLLAKIEKLHKDVFYHMIQPDV